VSVHKHWSKADTNQNCVENIYIGCALYVMSITTSPKFPCCKLNFLYVWVTQQLPADHLLFDHSGM